MTLSRITHIDYDYLRKAIHQGSKRELSVRNLVKIAVALRLTLDEAFELINRAGRDIRYDWQPENEIYRRAIQAAQKETILTVQEILDEISPLPDDDWNLPDKVLFAFAVDRYIGE